MSNKFKILLFTSALFATVLCANAAQNQILSTGVRKVSDNTVNFTFYTQNENQEKPIVKSKGNNEYTILLPNLSDSTTRGINIAQTGGIVTSADVKTINEGAVTYTKVNVKTSKPVTINAETRKTSQTASELTNLNSIVSKVNLINKDIQTAKGTTPVATQAVQSPKVSQTPVKASTVKDIIKQNSASAPKRNVIQEAVAVNNVASHTPDVKKIEKKEIEKTPTENIKNIKPVSNVTKTSKKAVTKPVNKTPKVTAPVNTEENKPTDIALSNVATVDNDIDIIPEKIDNEISEDLSEPSYKNSFSLTEGFKKILFSPVTTVILLICALLAFFAFLFKKLTSNMSLSKNINDSLIEKLNSVLNRPKKKDFTDIVTNEKMSWQEKYRAFNEKNNTPAESENKKIDGNYVFELSNKKPENDNVSETKSDNSRFRGFGNSQKQTTENKSSKSYKLKSFRNDSGSKQSMRDKLDDIMENETQKTVTNSIKKAHDPQNMRIMLNSAIDNDREFYIVSDNDEYSLLGRVRNKLVILKNFGKTAPEDLQVRRAQGNSFIVKAGSYRTQIDVSDSDMNILAQV